LADVADPLGPLSIHSDPFLFSTNVEKKTNRMKNTQGKITGKEKGKMF
jgi:hypothetical protein